MKWKILHKQFWIDFYYSFPVQLLINNLKRNHVLLFVWIFLFGFVTENIATIFGVPYLFLDPEYLSQTDFRGFFIIGIAIGILISAYHITVYILDSYRFNFLGTVPRPFAVFCLNNSLLPLIFVVTYVVSIISFQLKNGQQTGWQITTEIVALLTGIGVTIFILSIYFRLTNKDVFKELANNVDNSFRKNPISRVNVLRKMKSSKRNKHNVNVYLDFPLKIRQVEEYNIYDKEVLLKIFDQNHLNAVIVEIVIIIILITLGLFRDSEYFQLPAGASIILLFSMFVMFTGAFSYWMKGWAISILILTLFVFNFLLKNKIISSVYQVYGINYNKKPAEYSIERLNTLSSITNCMNDIKSTLAILENWKKKFPPGSKPKMIFLCTSGGGQRAAVWTTRVMQFTDSATNGDFMKHTSLMTGASGGLVGAAYYRELYHMKTYDSTLCLSSRSIFDNMAKDVLNSTVFSLVVNDIFFRFQRFTDGQYEYIKDRGYAFEQQIIRNTGNILDKRIKDYRKPEQEARIPMLMICPTIINDGRKLYISPQNISYMTIASEYANRKFNQKIKGIEFNRFFEQHDADNLHFMSALRMSATFPYVMPNVDLPSEPSMEIMDAGLSDNIGVRDAMRFIHVFKDWISENTGGIVFVIIRDSEKDGAIREQKETSLFQKMITPIGSLYSNWDYFQDFTNDQLIELAQSWYKGPFDLVEFQYIPRYEYWKNNKEEYSSLDNWEKNRAVLSWHLTKREKESLYNTIYEANNLAALAKLKKLLYNTTE
ncbi:MAG: patatin-like phospholipase family protein [Cytophagaceae bacterium]|nr:patatin-like phospholipase family protein [Cytophagaceae bacterium]MDW8455554.1 patatin-like phospholipase family protein [Cytophagaceae bacterium]